jgi:hypothetical protein
MPAAREVRPVHRAQHAVPQSPSCVRRCDGRGGCGTSQRRSYWEDKHQQFARASSSIARSKCLLRLELRDVARAFPSHALVTR